MEKKTYSVEITRFIHLTEEDIENIVVTALEGGVGYWACLDNTGDEYENAPEDEAVSETTTRILLEGGAVHIIDDEAEMHDLTLQDLLDGVKKYVERGFDVYNVFSGDCDWVSFDADCADTIFQLALFGEVVYG